MQIIEEFKKRVKNKNYTLVLPEGKDPRILESARILKDNALAEPVILGKEKEIEQAASQCGVDLSDMSVIVPRTSPQLDEYAEKYIEGRSDLSVRVARRLVMKPLFFGGMMVKTGAADAMVAGAANATASVIQAGVLTVGFAPGMNTPSSFFIMILPEFQGVKNKMLVYADCAVTIDPNAEELADIACASSASCTKLLNEEARVAMLSFSTRGSASHDHVDKVTKALEIARSRDKNLAIDGEFQADSALVPRVAEKKVKGGSPVAGKANVLIFPDLDAGNIAYKLTQYLAGAAAIGPFLQGFAKPVSDLSRGASVEDIVSVSAITLAQV